MKTLKALLASGVLGSLLVCSAASHAQGIVYGDSAALGQGMVYVWADTLAGGTPNKIGVTLTGGALQGLPATAQARSLEFPDVGVASLFEHVFLNWNPAGHDPAPIYGVPHFDIHYYVISESDRNAIIPGNDLIPVAPEFLPPNYANEDGFFSVPGMGVHYVDTTSAEFHGQPFTTTMIYGFYHGDFIFVEPMITRAYLLTQPDTTMAIPQPAAYQETGYYPTTYTIEYVSELDVVNVTLENFVYRTSMAAEPQPGVTLPADFVLLKNYPNPFNPSTTVEYALPRQGHVTLKVYDLAGREVATLVDGIRAAGSYTVAFDAGRLGSGVYLTRLEAGGLTATRKMLLVK